MTKKMKGNPSMDEYYSKELVPPKAKMKPFGGKKDAETKEQMTKKKMAARTPGSFDRKGIEDLRRMKKEYRV